MRSIGLPELILIAVALVFGYRLLKGSNIVATLALGLLGSLLGALVGFLMRPSFPLVGQLDLDVVLSRGMSLKGIDGAMRSTAEQSCNYVLIGAIVGGSLFALVKMGRTTNQQPALTVPTPTDPAPSSGVSFCTNCGKQLDTEMRFCGACGIERK